MNILSVRYLLETGRRAHWVVAAIAWLLFVSGCGRPSEIAERATLRLTTRELEQSSRFELVLDDPVARHDDLGLSTESPLVIDPAVPGTFVWRGRRTGIFTPSEPLRLGTRFVFSLRPGLRDAENRPVNARLRRVFETPGLKVSLERRGWWNGDDMPVSPHVTARFNAVVDPRELVRHAEFTDGHTTVRAVVIVTDTDSPGESNPPGDKNAPSVPSASLQFTLEPARPLISPHLWNFRITPGLASPAVAVRSAAAESIALGRAVPFALVSTETVNEIQGGRKIRFRFTRPVAASLVTNDPVTWFHCEPLVTNLTVELAPGGRVLLVSGAFQLATDYRVSVASGLPGQEPVVLSPGGDEVVRFEPITPTVWFPAFDTVQLAAGNREFGLLAINTPETRVRVKALDRHGLIPALRAYERYLRSKDSQAPDLLPGGPLDYAAIPGRTVHDESFNTQSAIDAIHTRSLSWNSLAGGPGAYFVEAHLHGLPPGSGRADTQVGPQSIVQLTDLGLLSKTGANSTWVWVFSHMDARPLSGVTVSLRSDENELLHEAVTDTDGLARFPAIPTAAWVLAESGGDQHAKRLAEGNVSTWQFHLPGRWENSPETRLFAFTDREAYRPGEVLRLKVLARTWKEDAWEFPTNTVVQVQISGPRGDLTLRTNLLLSATGAADWGWEVPLATRGTYRLQLEAGNSQVDREVEVRDFQPAAFEVRLGAKPAYNPGDLVSVPFSARYLFGQDLSQAKLLWTTQADDAGFRPDGWENFQFCASTRDWRLREGSGQRGESHRVGRVEIDPDTPRAIDLDLPPNPVFPQPQRVQVTAEVTDLNQQTIASQAEFVRHASAFYLGFRWTRGAEAVLATNTPLAFRLVAVRSDGQPWPVPVESKARLRRIDWRSVAILRAGRVVGHQSEPIYHDVSEIIVRTRNMVRVGTQWEVEESGANEELLPPLAEPGQYVLELSARDDAGFSVLTVVEFHVAGDGRLAWHEMNGAQVALVPDRYSHTGGDTATLLVKAPFDATALVTVEREDVRRAFTIPLRGNAPAIQVPLQTNDAPNVFVGVTLVRGSQGNPHRFPMPEWRVGYESLSVPPEQDRLHVTVKAEPSVPRPGDIVSIQTEIRDAAGQAVPGAEVTLYAVDEGYLVLKGTEAPDPYTRFSELRRLGVATQLSLPELLPEDPEFRSFGNKGHFAGGGGRTSQARRNFVPCPFWNGNLVSDANGALAVSFAAPDSLTRYRVVAVATRGPQAMGTGVDTFEVRKPLMIESAMPRFAHVGDHLWARALIFNQSTQTLSVRAALIPGTNAVFETLNCSPGRLEIPANGTAKVEFPVRFVSPGATEWKWSVESDSLSDAVIVVLPVTRAEVGLRDVRHFRLAAGVTNLVETVDAVLMEEPDSMVVHLAASPLAFLGESVHQLVHYPYGCIEQTASSLLPWIALRDSPSLLPPDRRAATNIDAALDAGVQRFWSMQTASGGLAYWPGGTVPQRWGSAYAAWVLALARSAGVDVPTNRTARLHQWLNEQARSDKSFPDAETLHVRCLTAFAFAAEQAPEAALLESLWEARERIATEDRALLAVALLQARQDHERARDLLGMKPRKVEPHGQFGSDTRVKAIRLLAHSAIDPESSETSELLATVIQSLRGGARETTQDNAWALWTLADQAHRKGPPRPFGGEVRLGTVAHRFFGGPDQPVTQLELPLTSANLKAGAFLTHQSPFPLYVEVTVSGRRPSGTNMPVALDRGFGLRRRYEKLDSTNRPHPLDGLRVGDRVLVTLEIDAADDAEWVAIEDPLPAVLEPVHGVFKTEMAGAGALVDEWSNDFREVRFDRTLTFRDALPEGRHRVQYLARVRAAGDVVAAPAKIEAMYQPQRHGYSEGTRLRAAAAETGPP